MNHVLESSVSERGQVTLPKELRDRYGLLAGTPVAFIPSSKGLLIRKSVDKNNNPFKKLVGIIKDGTKTDDYLNEIRGSVE